MENADEEVMQSLKTGKQNSCWDYNSRFLLRLTLHLMIVFLLFLILLQVILFSVFYHKISDKGLITATPFGSLVPNNTTLDPCVFPRSAEASPLTELACPGGTFCPIGWTCTIVADQDTGENTYACLNNAVSCGDLHYCTNYIFDLEETTNTTIPARVIEIGISETFYLLAVIPTFLSIFLLAIMWIIFNLWNVMVSDPFKPRSPEETSGALGSIYRKYRNIVPSNISSWIQCQINIVSKKKKKFLFF